MAKSREKRASSEATQQDTPSRPSSMEASNAQAQEAFQRATRGAATAVPYRTELESFFGTDLGGIEAYVGVGGLGALDTPAAAQDNAIVFADPSPPKEQVVEELTHVLQRQNGGGGGGTTRPGDPAEREASAVRAQFGPGQQAPALTAAPSGIAREDPPGTALERLRAASEGNWIGDVSESDCLRLINSLTPAEKIQARADTLLMSRLASALNAEEMLQCVNALGFELKWKAYWLQQANELDIGAINWQTLLAAPAEEVRAFLGWSSLFEVCYPYFGTTPILLFAAIRGTPEWSSLLASSKTLVQWMLDSTTAQAAVDELGGPGIAEADLSSISTHVADTKGWTEVLEALPAGGGMPATTRAALRRFKDIWGAETAKVAFKIRFGHDLEGRWEDTNNPGEEASFGDFIMGDAEFVDWKIDEIRVIWDQLDVLPDQDITENTVLRSFIAIRHNWAGGFWANPDIQIRQGAAGDPTSLEHTIRHEIGHSVHEGSLNGSINSWVQNDIGFWYEGSEEQGFKDIISALGGWPSTWTDSSGASQPFGDADKEAILDMLEAHSGSTRALQATGDPLPNATAPTDDLGRKWAAMPAAVRSSFTLSANAWYNNYNTFPSGPRGGMFYNHYYERAYHISALAKTTVASTGDTYTAMSEKEFFANCYAEYFENPAGYSDHTLWGGNLPGAVKSFFGSVIVEHQPYDAGTYSTATTTPATADASTGTSTTGPTSGH